MMETDLELTFDMTSLLTLEEVLTLKLRTAQTEGGISVLQQAEAIMADSQAQVPEDTGTLAAAGFVDSENLGGDPTVRIGYDGTFLNPKTGELVSEYIMPVHERLDVMHPKGNAKFFENPVIQYAPKFEPTLASIIAKALMG